MIVLIKELKLYLLQQEKFRMVSLKEVLFLLWFAACAKALCSNATICITNGDEGESQCQQNLHTLSDLTINQTSCETVHIYLTSGTHILSRNLDFNNSVQETVICGASQGPPSIIECQGETGIEFSENTSVRMELVELLHCNRTRNIHQTLQATLFFKNSQYTLSGVTVKNTEGWGVYAEDCWEQIIFNCTFINNKGNIAIRGTYTAYQQIVQVEINNTKIHDGKQSDQSGYGINIHLETYTIISNLILRIINCDLQRNKGGHFNLKIYNVINFTILIDNSTFSKSDNYGIMINFLGRDTEYDYRAITLRRSSFSKNSKSGLFLVALNYIKIEDCIIDSNKDTGVEAENWYDLWTEISNTTFTNNSRAISLNNQWRKIDTKISECRFTNHTGNSVVVIKNNEGITDNIGKITIEKSSFQGNRKVIGYEVCSVLFIDSVNNITLSDVNITDNNCTGIKLIHSTIKLENLVSLSGNHGQNGGGLYLSMSKLIFSTSSKLNIINNSADVYGGGLYLEEKTCTSDNTCFFQLEEEYSSNSSQVIAFSGNHAKERGDQMLGGCLSHCSIQFNKKKTFLNVCDLNNMFWSFVSSANTSFLGHKKKLAFCKTDSDSSISSFSCSYSNSIHVYRGQMFNVTLMVADDCCFPSSANYIEAKVK